MSRNINPVLSLFSRPENSAHSSETIWHGALILVSRTILVLLLLFVAASASGQDASPQKPAAQAASIRGAVTTVQDNTPSGVAGISVKLSGNPLHGTPLNADTDEHGAYEFQNLEPGTYTLSISLQGFKSISKSVALAPKQQLVQDFNLELDVVAEKVEVKETAASISTETAAPPPATVTNVELTTIPTPQEKVKDILPFTPGVIKTLDSKLTLKGADENQSLLLVNSARTTDPVTGSCGVPIPTDAVESFAVYKTPYDSSLGSFSGGLTTIETRPRDRQWSFKVRGIVPSVLGKKGGMVGLAEAIPGVSFDAPLIPHKFLLSESFQYEMKKTTVEGLPWPFDISKRQGFNSFTTLEAILAPNHVLTLTVNLFPLRQQHADISALVPQPASNDLNQSGWAIGLSDKYQFSSGAIFSFVGQYMRFDSNAHGQGPADMLITPEGWGGNFFNQWSRRGKEFQVVSAYQFAEKHWLGRHELHVGADFDHRSYAGVSSSNPVQMLRQDGTLAEGINFLPGTAQNASDTAVAEFIQDHWVMNSHWAVDLGARLSSETKGWSVAVAPRAGVAYSPGKDGKTVVRTGVGLFYSLLPLLAGDFAANPTRVITPFDTAGLPSGLPVTYTNAYAGGMNPLTASALLSQPGTTPRNLTWNVAVERELRKNIFLRVGYIDSHTTYLFTVNPFTAGPAAPSFLALTNTGSSHYRELESTVHFTFHRNDEVNVSYIWSRTRGDLNNLSSVLIPFAQPVIRPNVYGILPYDVPNRVVTWGIVSLPRGFKFSPIADIHTGYPYSNIDTLQNYVGTPNGQRFNSFFTLDVKLYREFRIPFLGSEHGKGKAHHVRLGVYSLNVTNHGNFNAVYNNVTAPNFGQFAGFQDRREGAVIDFID